MTLLRKIVTGVQGLFRRRELDQQLDEELHAYLEMSADAKIQAGMSKAEALRIARADMGSITAVKDQVHRAGWESPMQEFGRDLHLGMRMLRRNPGVTAVIVLTMALGIGLNTGVFTIFNSAASQLLPVPHAQELLVVSQSFEKSRAPVRRNVHNDAGYFSVSEYLQYRDHNQVFSGLLAYSPFVTASLGGGERQQLIGTLASCNYFSVLQVALQLGHGFDDSDCHAVGASPVVVLSDELWRTAFAADPAIVGKRVNLNRTPFVVAGIAAAGFEGTEPVKSQFWAPLTMQNALMRGHDYFHDDRLSWLALMGRTRPHVSQHQIQADLAVIAAQIDRLQPGRVTTIKTRQATLFAAPVERLVLNSAGAVLLLAVGMVLLIACANVANLLLARAVVRRKEIAVKRALGAGRWRLVRQFLAESLILAFMGGSVGSALAVWLANPLLNLLLSHLPPGTPPLALRAAPDFHVLAFMLLLSFITGVVFGLAPALQATRADLTVAMKEEVPDVQSESRRGGWLRNSLVAVQMAVCLILMITAGLLLRGLQHTYDIDPGFSMKHIATISFDLIGSGYDGQRAAAFQQQLMERISAVAGVDRVAQAGVSPLSDDHRVNTFSIPEVNREYNIEFNDVSPEYFPLLGIPIIRGRNFTSAENRTESPVAIVSESVARRLWPGQNAIGKTIRDGVGENAPTLEVVGVSRNAQVSSLGRSDTPYLFRPAGPKQQAGTVLMAHYAGDSASTFRDIKTAVKGLDPELPVRIAKLEDNMEFWRSLTLIPSVLSTTLGALALLLASLGVYGMVSYAVSRRVREIGIRMALGAGARNVASLIVRQGMRPVTVGVVIGVACSAAISGLMSSLLYGVSPWDPISFLAVAGFLFIVALVACWIPARRAARVDPMEALRCG